MFEQYPDIVDVKQMREMLGGISKNLAYELLKNNRVRHTKIGREYKIPKASLIELVNGEEKEQPAE